jgi:hypothetical protein
MRQAAGSIRAEAGPAQGDCVRTVHLCENNVKGLVRTLRTVKGVCGSRDAPFAPRWWLLLKDCLLAEGTYNDWSVAIHRRHGFDLAIRLNRYIMV